MKRHLGASRSRSGKLSAAGAIGLAALLCITAAAMGATVIGPVTTFQAQFTTARSGAFTGLTLRTTGMPPAAGNAEAAAVRQTVRLPAGSRLRLASLPQCRASASTIAAEGAEGACPARTRVGTGQALGVLNGAAVRFDLGIYAVRGRLVFAAERGGQPLKQSFDGLGHGRRLVLTVPTLGGTIAPTGFSAHIPSRPGARGWLRTPATCPQRARWTVVGTFQGVDGTAPSAKPVTPAQTRTAHIMCR